jgi:DNA-binding IclR family transcriptional regulator
MNKRRLHCLKAVFDFPLATVSEIAAKAKIPENQASINLRALQARGLITAVRKSRWTHYLPEADPLVEHARDTLEAIRCALAKRNSTTDTLITLRAFTHSRRLAILIVLQRQATATAEQLRAATDISLPAVWRHLATLCESGLVFHDADTDEWRLVAQHKRTLLAKRLLSIVSSPSSHNS